MKNTASGEPVEKGRIRLASLMVLTLIVTVLFWVCIQIFHLQGLPLYFTQLGLYLVFFLLAGWGIKQEHIPLPVTRRSAAAAVVCALLGWVVFALLIQLFGLANLFHEFQALQKVPAWKVALQILSTWFFVGLGEEVLFRGYFLAAFRKHFTRADRQHREIIAVLLSSAFFSLWHLPARIVELLSGGLDWATLLLSLFMLFLLGLGFCFLYLRSGNILLAGLVHGLMDYPLIGKDTQLSFIILLAAIACVEIGRRVTMKRARGQLTMPE